MAKTKTPTVWIDYQKIIPEVIFADDLRKDEFEDTGCYWRKAPDKEAQEIVLPPATSHPRPLRF